jgi:anti-sigma regulatory factor (Ser/Thr protein kinase)
MSHHRSRRTSSLGTASPQPGDTRGFILAQRGRWAAVRCDGTFCESERCENERQSSPHTGCDDYVEEQPLHGPPEQNLVATVSHELRNPIAAINGYAQILRRRGSYDDHLVERILTQTALVARLLDDLLDGCSMESVAPELRLADVDIVAAVRSSVDEARVLTDMHDFRCECAPGPLMVLCDPDRVSQVLRNLFSNAVKYSPGGGEIVVKVERAGSTVCVSVSDHGIGIPPEALPRIFDSYFRVGGSQNRAGGVGLGLPIARRLIEAHGGSLSVVSQPGRGTTFTFTLWLMDPLPDSQMPRTPRPDFKWESSDAARRQIGRPTVSASATSCRPGEGRSLDPESCEAPVTAGS